MSHRAAFLVVALGSFAVALIASLSWQRAALGGPGPRPDPTAPRPAPRADLRPGPQPGAIPEDWPKPELHAGLTEPQIAAAIAAYAKQLADAGRFSGVVLAAHLGQVVVTRAYGLRDVAANAPNTVDTKLNIGSIGKLFTRAAIAQLAEAGKLSLDDTVRKHLPELAIAGADRITIGQLLEHRSGMGDIFGPRYDAAPPSRLRELADFVPLFVDQPLDFEPGSGQRYANAGYVTLGLIVERLTGETYRDYLAKHLFAPAKLTSTGFWAVDEPVANRAIGYRSARPGAAGPRVPNTDTLPGRPSSAGGAFSTAGDLLRFWEALVGGKLLSPRWTNWMVNGSFDDARRSPAIGLGGGAPGVNAGIELEDGWIVIALANFDPPSAQAVSHGAMDIIRGHRRTAPPPGATVRHVGPR